MYIDTIDTIYFGKSTHSWLFLAYRQNKHKTKMQGLFTHTAAHAYNLKEA